jgi:hypothetical protein
MTKFCALTRFTHCFLTDSKSFIYAKPFFFFLLIDLAVSFCLVVVFHRSSLVCFFGVEVLSRH